jgi:LysM repeat protein
MPPLTRSQISRYAAPVGFLLAATIAVLLIRAGLGNSSEADTTTVPTAPAAATTTKRAATTTRSATRVTATEPTTTDAGEFYTIQSGDTLGGIAIQFETTVAELLELNPGIDPRDLHAGQRVRVG